MYLFHSEWEGQLIFCAEPASSAVHLRRVHAVPVAAACVYRPCPQRSPDGTHRGVILAAAVCYLLLDVSAPQQCDNINCTYYVWSAILIIDSLVAPNHGPLLSAPFTCCSLFFLSRTKRFGTGTTLQHHQVLYILY